MWGMYFENPTGSVVFGKELAVLDDPDAVAYVYGEDADEEKGEKNKNDENDSRHDAMGGDARHPGPTRSLGRRRAHVRRGRHAAARCPLGRRAARAAILGNDLRGSVLDELIGDGR
jgi:hypothetical protein